MRKVLASLAVACLASAATAQTFDPTGWPTIRYDSGHGGTSWKVTGPSGPSDWFNVKMDPTDTSGFVAYGILTAFLDTQGIGGTMKEIGLRTSNAAGDPDVSAGGLIVAASSPVVAAGANPNNEHAWSCPQTTLGTDVHSVATWFSGDSNLWLPSDVSPPSAGRSFWTLDGYATGNNAFSPDWVLGIVGLPSGAMNSLLVNGSSSDTITQGDSVCLLFTACQTNVGSALFVTTPVFTYLGVPVLFTTTGNPFTGGPLSNQWTLCGTTDCNTPNGSVTLAVIFLDPCDLKPNGRPRAKLSGSAALTINGDPKCTGLCFGQKDDGGVDGSYWAVQAPAGPSDFFNVNHGSPKAGVVSMLTGISIPALDTCGTGSSWGGVGIYPDNGATPGDPVLASPFGTATSLTVAPGAADTAYPGQVYPIAPFAASTTTTYHAVVGWAPGETCIWVGADTSGSGGCADPIGGANTSSGWTLDGYASPGNYVNYANWMLKIDWL